MERNPIDAETADRLLSGAVAPEDAPPGYAGVAVLMQAARQAPLPDELGASADTVAAMMATVAAAEPTVVRARRRAGLTRLLRPRIAATLMAGALALFGGLASAGALPGPLQHAAHVMFGAVGIPVPDRAGAVAAPSVSAGGVPPDTSLGRTTRSAAVTRAGGAPAAHSPARAPRAASHGAAARASQPATASRASSSAPVQAKTRPSGSHSGTVSGSGFAGRRGLCNAWTRGEGKKKGEAFRRLRSRARAKGDSVAEFCGDPSARAGPIPANR